MKKTNKKLTKIIARKERNKGNQFYVMMKGIFVFINWRTRSWK